MILSKVSENAGWDEKWHIIIFVNLNRILNVPRFAETWEFTYNP
jgi:hypothetical protein